VRDEAPPTSEVRAVTSLRSRRLAKSLFTLALAFAAAPLPRAAAQCAM
jgi:hypothetical protein